MKKKKKKKVNKKKFISRFMLLILIIVIIIFAINFFSKGKKPKYDTSVIVNNEDITENLSDEPYINKDKVLYLSVKDVGKIFDEGIYYEEETRKIITCYGTKVAAISVDDNIVELNSANIVLSSGVLDYKTNIYLPISELNNIYNIEASVTENSAIISSLYEEFTTIKLTKKTSLKKKPSGFSNTIEKMEEGTELIFIKDTEKNGWIKVLNFNR